MSGIGEQLSVFFSDRKRGIRFKIEKFFVDVPQEDNQIIHRFQTKTSMYICYIDLYMLLLVVLQ